MRVWDVHPGYLSRQSLLGQHAEIHAIYSVLSKGKKGYSNHPETIRWANKLNILIKRHDLTAKEMILRGHNHNSPLQIQKEIYNSSDKLSFVDSPGKQFAILREKYAKDHRTGRIPLPKNSSSFWAQHKYSVMTRGYQYYKEIQQALNKRKDMPVSQDDELIGFVYDKMEIAPSEKAVINVIDHLWGYFKKISTITEREAFLKLRSEGFNLQLNYLYSLAIKYDASYLIESTVFADFIL